MYAIIHTQTQIQSEGRVDVWVPLRKIVIFQDEHDAYTAITDHPSFIVFIGKRTMIRPSRKTQ